MKCCSCSKGCELHIQRDGQHQLIVTGGACHRGEAYAMKMLEQSKNQGDFSVYRGHVSVRNGFMSHLMVVSDREIPKEAFSEIDNRLKAMKLEAPVDKGQVVYENLEKSEIRLIALRGMKQRKVKPKEKAER